MSQSVPPQPRSPPLLCAGPIGVVNGNGSNVGGHPGAGAHMMRHNHPHPLSRSPSAISDEQNAPPPPPSLLGPGINSSVGSAISSSSPARRRGGGVPLCAPVSVRAPAPRRHDWHARSSSNVGAFYDAGGIGSGAGSSVWVQGHGRSASVGSGSNNHSFSADVSPHAGLAGAPLPTGARSPLGPRVVQGPPQWRPQQQRSLSAMDLGDMPPMSLGGSGSGNGGLLPPPVRVSPTPPGAGSASGGGGRSDWLAVQQAFGSPSSALHMPPPVVVPTSPTDGHSTAAAVVGTVVSDSPLRGLARRSSSSPSLVPTAYGTDDKRSNIVSVAVGSGRESGGGNTEQQAVGGGDGGIGGGGAKQQLEGRAGGGSGGDDDDGSLVEELGKMQKQIEAMLEKHSKSLEGKIGETEQAISARLALLETKVRGLEIGSPLQG